MSGICGIVQRDRQPVEADALYRMMAALAHRGPDDTGTWVDGPVALGHLMLHTTPESLQEKLPLTGGGGSLMLTADARIDNRPELLSHFDFSGRPPAEVADSELILAAYEKWGEYCPEKLIGDFAFAIWDQSHQRLFCARDTMGVRPFYYYTSERLFAFASEIKALFCLPDVPRAINPRAVAYFMAALEDDKIVTFYEDIV
ncbi:MAG: asparagine synthetase B, partial [Anaerolineae bacterium]|nr:asparagine synthetase B [Anaerolineae bacterium]